MKKIGKRLFSIVFLLCCAFLWNLQTVDAKASDPIKEIDSYIQNNRNKNHIPGLSIAVTYQNKVIFSKGYGNTSNGKVTVDTPFAIASLSKAFTAMAVMQLVESGKIQLDQPVATYLPDFYLADPRGKNITIRQLLQHTSGLTDQVNADMTLHPQPKSFSDFIQHLHTVSLMSEPGKEYHYHNPNYIILAYLVETVSKEKFADYLQKYILQPLDMTNTKVVSSTSQLESISNLSKGHYFLFGQPVQAKEPNWFVEGPAGIISTANDMAKWLLLQENKGRYKGKQILSEAGIRQTHTSLDPNIKYGMGWNLSKSDQEKNQISHTGILWTYKSETIIQPAEGLGVVVLFNSGLNAFVDYASFSNGIMDILTNKPVSESFFSNQWAEIIVVVCMLLTVIWTISSIKNKDKWYQKRISRPKWLIFLGLSLHVIPLLLVLFLPQILPFIGGGRVITWTGMYFMMPSLCIFLLLVGICHMIVLGFLLYRMKTNKKDMIK
jgi:CubicO group peptidase (beta-lactamase class C family)